MIALHTSERLDSLATDTESPATDDDIGAILDAIAPVCQSDGPSDGLLSEPAGGQCRPLDFH